MASSGIEVGDDRPLISASSYSHSDDDNSEDSAVIMSIPRCDTLNARDSYGAAVVSNDAVDEQNELDTRKHHSCCSYNIFKNWTPFQVASLVIMITIIAAVFTGPVAYRCYKYSRHIRQNVSLHVFYS